MFSHVYENELVVREMECAMCGLIITDNIVENSINFRILYVTAYSGL